MRIPGLFFSLVFCAASGSFCMPLGVYAESNPIRLGGIFSLSGFGAKGGVGEMRAAQLAVGQINAAGGVAGRKIELLIEDNQSDLKATANAFSKLVKINDVDGIVGPNWTEFSSVAAPLAERAKVPMITPSGVLNSKGLRRDVPSFVFTLMEPPIETNRALAEALYASPEIAEVLGLVQNNLYLENAWEAAKQIWGTKYGITEVRIAGSESPDYRSILLRAANKPNVAIYASLLPGQYQAILQARRQLGISAPVFAVDILYDEAVAHDAELLKGVTATDYKLLGSKAFRAAFEARFNDKPLNYAPKAYDAVRLLAEANVECGRRSVSCLVSVDKQGESGHLKFNSENVLITEGPPTQIYVYVDSKSDSGGAWQPVPNRPIN